MNDARDDPAAEPPEEPDRKPSEGEAKATDRGEASESATRESEAEGGRKAKRPSGGDESEAKRPRPKGKRRRAWLGRRRERRESERKSGARREQRESSAARRTAKGAAGAKARSEREPVAGRKPEAKGKGEAKAAEGRGAAERRKAAEGRKPGAKARTGSKDGGREKPKKAVGKKPSDAISRGIRSAVARAGGWVRRGRKLLLIPAAIWMRIAEVAGAGVLAVWRRALLPALVAIWRALRRLLALAERHVTPARAVTAVALGAALALAASQWVDYRSITVGNEAYSGEVGVVAAAPEVDHQRAGDAHSWVMLPLAAAAIVVVLLSLTGGRKRAHLLIAIGIAVITISVIVDAPKGLDEGSAAVAYENAEANLLEGFWAQVAAGGVLVACGFLLPMQLRAATASTDRSTRSEVGARDTRKPAANRGGEKRRRLPSLPKPTARGAQEDGWGEGAKRRRGSGPSDATGSSA